ncbi:exodeoxyribonuclease [Spirochaetota bacterium]|nr:exodeoxyribonuclease [Spirochaetota bacterium]
MKIITWNVNGLRAVHNRDALLPLLRTERPDVLLLQEIKGMEAQFSDVLKDNSEYEISYHSARQPGYAGTGLWVRKDAPISDRALLKGMPALAKEQGDYEGRILGIKGFYKKTTSNIPIVILGIYFPNGGKSNDAFEEKLVFYKNFLSYVDALSKKGALCIWGGDINCAHTPIDLARPKENDGKVGFHPRERKWLDNVISHHWIDVFRHCYPDLKDTYSWWSYRSGAREKNVGWRIDYFFMKKANFNHVKKITYLPTVTGSDHCPLLLELHS